jgi:MFS family permease
MVLFGLGEVLGCFFIGAIVDKFGSKMAVFANIGIILTMGGVTFAFSYIWEFNALAWVMTFMWGFQDSALNTHTSEMLGFEFDDNYTPFSLFNIWQSISCFTFQIVNSYFDS